MWRKDLCDIPKPNVLNCNCAFALDAMEQYLVVLYAGLTGSVTMITCTVLALTRLVFEYKGKKVYIVFLRLQMYSTIPVCLFVIQVL